MSDLYDFAELYDAQYRRYRDDLAFYRRLVEDYAGSGGGPVLELGCGSGRVTVELARTGAEVVAVDLSGAMLERADERLRDAALDDRVELRRGDMRALELRRSFALVVAPFNTLMHAYTLDEQDATLASARRHLRAGGAFACDCFVPDFGALGVVRQEAEWDEVGGDRGELFVLQRHDPSRQLIESRYHLDTVAPSGAVTRRRATLVQRYYHRFELERALRQADFSRVQLFGGFDRRPLSPESRVMVALARA